MKKNVDKNQAKGYLLRNLLTKMKTITRPNGSLVTISGNSVTEGSKTFRANCLRPAVESDKSPGNWFGKNPADYLIDQSIGGSRLLAAADGVAEAVEAHRAAGEHKNDEASAYRASQVAVLERTIESISRTENNYHIAEKDINNLLRENGMKGACE